MDCAARVLHRGRDVVAAAPATLRLKCGEFSLGGAEGAGKDTRWRAKSCGTTLPSFERHVSLPLGARRGG